MTHLLRFTEISETTQQKHYVGATSCHAISVRGINSPTAVHQTSATPASSSTATPSTSASTAPALKRFKFLSEKLQQSGSADDRSQSSRACPNRPQSSCSQTNVGHHCLRKMPSPSGGDGRQPIYSLPGPLAQDLVAAPASQAYVERVFSVCGWLTVGRRNRLS